MPQSPEGMSVQLAVVCRVILGMWDITLSASTEGLGSELNLKELCYIHYIIPLMGENLE